MAHSSIAWIISVYLFSTDFLKINTLVASYKIHLRTEKKGRNNYPGIKQIVIFLIQSLQHSAKQFSHNELTFKQCETSEKLKSLSFYIKDGLEPN